MKPHTEGAYWRYVEGCRCVPCTVANREYHRTYRDRMKLGNLDVDAPQHNDTKRTHLTKVSKIRVSIRPLLEFMNHENDTVTAGRLGTTRGQVVRWKREGISILTADRLACHIGEHPYTIWGNDYFKGTP